MKDVLFTMPDGIDPKDRKAAREAAKACVYAVSRVAQTVASALKCTRVTTRAQLFCLFELDKSYNEATHYEANFSLPDEKDSLSVQAVKLAGDLRKSIRRATQAFRSSYSAPPEEWRVLWDVYRDEFGNEVGPSSADSEYREVEIDVDEKGPITKGRIFVPDEMLAPHWDPNAWVGVCWCVEEIGVDRLQQIAKEMAEEFLKDDEVPFEEPSPVEDDPSSKRSVDPDPPEIPDEDDDWPKVNKDLCQVRYRDKCHDVTESQSMGIDALVRAKGDWVSWSGLGISKPSEVKEGLPQELQELIETSSGKGYRMVLPK